MRTTIRILTITAALAALTAFAGVHRPAVDPGTVAPTTPPSTAPEPSPEPPAPPKPALNPDPAHPSGDLIEISIRHQRLTAWRDGRVVYRFVISTGRPGYETPAGHFRILEKYPNRWSRTWKVWMPFAMRWYQGYFIHQLPHEDGSSYNIGASKLGKPDSHGCIRVDVGDAERLFRWTEVGTPVWIH